MAVNIADLVGGFGAALTGTAPEYVAGVQKREEIASVKKQEQMAAREKAMYQDAGVALQLMEAGDLQGVVDLGMDRMKMLGQFGDSNPEDTMRIITLARRAQGGDRNAMAQLQAELMTASRIGTARGYIAAPERVKGVEVNGELRNPFTGERLGPAAINQEENRKTSQDQNGVLRYLDTGEPVFPNIQKDAAIAPDTTNADSEALRKEFNALTPVKDFSLQSSAYGRLLASANDPSPAGDLALIFNYMKVLDPGSTVREGEAASVRNAGNIPQRVLAQYNNLITGTGSLDEAQRADFVSRSGKLYKSAEEGFNKVFNQYSGIIKRRNLPIEDILIDYRYQQPVESGNPPTQPAGTPFFNNEAQVRSSGLPSGTVVEIPDPSNPQFILQVRVP
jgi:hypothetical protein